MKKALSLLLFLIVITAACCALGETAEAPAPARADHLDISAFEKNPNIFSVSAVEDNSSAVISVNISPADRAFSTPYDSPEYYSVLFPCISVLNYAAEAERLPVLTVYLSYRGTKLLNISSVSFIGGVMEQAEYRLTVDSSRVSETDKAAEEILMTLGRTAIGTGLVTDLCTEGYGYTMRLQYANEGQDVSADPPEWKVILHGDEDVEIALPASFWIEMSALTSGLADADALGLLGSMAGTPCEKIPIQ